MNGKRMINMLLYLVTGTLFTFLGSTSAKNTCKIVFIFKKRNLENQSAFSKIWDWQNVRTIVRLKKLYNKNMQKKLFKIAFSESLDNWLLKGIVVKE